MAAVAKKSVTLFVKGSTGMADIVMLNMVYSCKVWCLSYLLAPNNPNTVSLQFAR